MASRMQEVLKTKGTHNVGSVNDWELTGKLFVGGAIAKEKMDNYTMVEIEYNSDGEAVMKPLSSNTVKGLLLCASEEVLDEFGEQLCDFFVDKGEKGRCIYLTTPTRFQASNFELDTKVTEIKNGSKVHYDATKKKYIVSGDTPHADYEAAANKFIVHSSETETGYVIDDYDMIQLISQ